MKKILICLVAVALIAGLVALTACTQTEVIEVTREVEKEVRVEVTRVVKVDRPIEVTRVVEVVKEVKAYERYEVEVVVTATPTPVPELSRPAMVIEFGNKKDKEVKCGNERIPLIRLEPPLQRNYVSKTKCHLDKGVYIAYASCNRFNTNPYLAGGHFILDISDPDNYTNYTRRGFWKKDSIEFYLESSYLVGDRVRFNSDKYRVRIDTSCSDGWLHLHKDAKLIMVQE